MASILDRYGIKEVADVTFYKIDTDGSPAEPVLFLDTLKVSTIEQTAETADARGGKGNPKLITWDYGKEITVTIEDALFSPKSMSIMLGNGNVTPGTDYIRKTCVVRLDSSSGMAAEYITIDAPTYSDEAKTKINGSARQKVYIGSNSTTPTGYISVAESHMKFTNGKTGEELENSMLYSETGDELDSDAFTEAELKALFTTGLPAYKGQKVMFTYWMPASSNTIVISGDSFPGTYYVTGDTYARSDITGEDQFFQFVIPKAKMTAENTITLEAEGDPSTFSMNLTVLRPEDGEMMKLVQYDLA